MSILNEVKPLQSKRFKQKCLMTEHNFVKLDIRGYIVVCLSCGHFRQWKRRWIVEGYARKVVSINMTIFKQVRQEELDGLPF